MVKVAKRNNGPALTGPPSFVERRRRHVPSQYALQPGSSSTLAVDCCFVLPLQVEQLYAFGGVTPAERLFQYMLSAGFGKKDGGTNQFGPIVGIEMGIAWYPMSGFSTRRAG